MFCVITNNTKQVFDDGQLLTSTIANDLARHIRAALGGSEVTIYNLLESEQLIWCLTLFNAYCSIDRQKDKKKTIDLRMKLINSVASVSVPSLLVTLMERVNLNATVGMLVVF